MSGRPVPEKGGYGAGDPLPDWEREFLEAQLDSRWEWHFVQALGMPERWIRGRCLHTEVEPVESSGAVVARLCLTCDAQLPAEVPPPGRAGIVRAGECGTTKPAALSRAAGELSQVSGGGSGI